MFSKAFYKLMSVVVMLIIFVYVYSFGLPPINNGPYPIRVVVNDGDSLPQVAAKLYSNGVIRSEELFRIVMGAVDLATDIRPGVYSFDQSVSLWSVIEKFATRRPDKPAMSITIPEGFNNEEIFERIVFYLPHLNRSKFLELARDKQGMLFPDTYHLQSTMNEESIIQLMHDEFLDKTAFLRVDNDASSTQSLNDILIMASILEGESKETGKEMQVIAGILYKRMREGIKLQVDVARETYKTKGLPKYPINNPGLASIQAAMNPIETTYMYYLHDNTGLIHYAETYKDHLSNINKHLK